MWRCSDLTTAALDAQLPTYRTRDYARLGAKEMTELLLKIEAQYGSPVTRLAMKVMAMTFVRTSELIEAPWSESTCARPSGTFPPSG